MKPEYYTISAVISLLLVITSSLLLMRPEETSSRVEPRRYVSELGSDIPVDRRSQDDLTKNERDSGAGSGPITTGTIIEVASEERGGKKSAEEVQREVSRTRSASYERFKTRNKERFGDLLREMGLDESGLELAISIITDDMLAYAILRDDLDGHRLPTSSDIEEFHKQSEMLLSSLVGEEGTALLADAQNDRVLFESVEKALGEIQGKGYPISPAAEIALVGLIDSKQASSLMGDLISEGQIINKETENYIFQMREEMWSEWYASEGQNLSTAELVRMKKWYDDAVRKDLRTAKAVLRALQGTANGGG